MVENANDKNKSRLNFLDNDADKAMLAVLFMVVGSCRSVHIIKALCLNSLKKLYNVRLICNVCCLQSSLKNFNDRLVEISGILLVGSYWIKISDLVLKKCVRNKIVSGLFYMNNHEVKSPNTNVPWSKGRKAEVYWCRFWRIKSGRKLICLWRVFTKKIIKNNH